MLLMLTGIFIVRCGNHLETGMKSPVEKEELCPEPYLSTYKDAESKEAAFLEKTRTAPIDWFEELQRMQEAKEIQSAVNDIRFPSPDRYCSHGTGKQAVYQSSACSELYYAITKWISEHP